MIKLKPLSCLFVLIDRNLTKRTTRTPQKQKICLSYKTLHC